MLLGILAGWVLLAGMPTLAEKESPTSPGAGEIRLVRAMMCETVQEAIPVRPAVVFSINIGRVSCYSSFDAIPENTVIFHKWYFIDELSTQKKMTVKSPAWSTYSSIQLREADKGPWRVEITNADGTLLKKLRFSVTE
jgi:hypothetical protein